MGRPLVHGVGCMTREGSICAVTYLHQSVVCFDTRLPIIVQGLPPPPPQESEMGLPPPPSQDSEMGLSPAPSKESEMGLPPPPC